MEQKKYIVPSFLSHYLAKVAITFETRNMRKLFLPLFGLRVVLGKLAYRLHSHSKAPIRLFMDRRHNRALRKDRPHILIVRHLATHILDYNAHFLSWIRKHYPRINNRIKLGRNPGPTLDLKQTALLVQGI